MEVTLALDAGEWLASWTTASPEALARVKSLHPLASLCLSFFFLIKSSKPFSFHSMCDKQKRDDTAMYY